jgi:hypothetical protein
MKISLKFVRQCFLKFQFYYRDDESEVHLANKDALSRYHKFKLSGKTIACSAIALGLGAIFLVAAIIVTMA